jgi:uncharacterized protein YehS (DUF1456 family)
MTYNDLLRRLRYALNLNGETIAGLCALGGHGITPLEVLKLLKKEGEPGFVACTDLVLAAFLDGLIISRKYFAPKGITITSRVAIRFSATSYGD